MESSFSPIRELQVLAKLADLKDDHYHNLLTLSALMELLVDKGILTREEIQQKLDKLDEFRDQPPYPTV
ncbi:hypothetical protein DCC85_22575 [Paenibacillus sp. CAA11]|uniref:hypothetical protein n=1 Tax=Paenibacillus sp. CAA11 TaxID=1532905 RepID=UPI000D35AC4C|nr:hypothetical protein [Paenibacillus sp. CAA11]AWB46680.1 hypothetical protein DCC85_22575 [Paenibacillus sp. CAA11]